MEANAEKTGELLALRRQASRGTPQVRGQGVQGGHRGQGTGAPRRAVRRAGGTGSTQHRHKQAKRGARALAVLVLLLAPGPGMVLTARADHAAPAEPGVLDPAAREALVQQYLALFRGELDLDATPGEHPELAAGDRAGVLDDLLAAMHADPQLSGDFDPAVAGPKLGLSSPEDPLVDKDGAPLTAERVEALYRGLVHGLVFERPAMMASMEETLQGLVPTSPPPPDPATVAPPPADEREQNALREELEAEPLTQWANADPDAVPPEGFAITPVEGPAVLPGGVAVMSWPEPPAMPEGPAPMAPMPHPLTILDAAPMASWQDPTFRLELPELLRFLADHAEDPALGALQPVADLAQRELAPLPERVLEEMPEVATSIASIQGASADVDAALGRLQAPLPLLGDGASAALPPEVIDLLDLVAGQAARSMYRGTLNGHAFEGVVGVPTAVDADRDEGAVPTTEGAKDNGPDYLVEVAFVPVVSDPREGLVQLEPRVRVVAIAPPDATSLLAGVPALPPRPEAPPLPAGTTSGDRPRLEAMAGLAPAPAAPDLVVETTPMLRAVGPKPLDLAVSFFMPGTDEVASVVARAPSGAEDIQAVVRAPGLAMAVEAHGPAGPFDAFQVRGEGQVRTSLGVTGNLGGLVALEFAGTISVAEHRASVRIQPLRPGPWTAAVRQDLPGQFLALGAGAGALGPAEVTAAGSRLVVDAEAGATVGIAYQAFASGNLAHRGVILDRAAAHTEVTIGPGGIAFEASAADATIMAVAGDIAGNQWQRATWMQVQGTGRAFTLDAPAAAAMGTGSGVDFDSDRRVRAVRAVVAPAGGEFMQDSVGPGVFRVRDGLVAFHIEDARGASALPGPSGVAIDVDAPSAAPFLVEVVAGTDTRQFLFSNVPYRISAEVGPDAISLGGSGVVDRIDALLLRPLDGALAAPTKTALVLSELNGTAALAMAGPALNLFQTGNLTELIAAASNVRAPNGTYLLPSPPGASHILAQVNATARQYTARLTNLVAPLLGLGNLLAALTGGIGNVSLDLAVDGPICVKLGNNATSLTLCISNVPRHIGLKVNLLPRPIIRYEASEKIQEVNATLVAPGLRAVFYIQGIPKVIQLELGADGLVVSMDERLGGVGLLAELTNQTVPSAPVTTTLSLALKDLPKTLRLGWNPGGLAPAMDPGDFLGEVLLGLSRPTLGIGLTIQHLPPLSVAWSETGIAVDLSGDRIGLINLRLVLAPLDPAKALNATLLAQGVPGITASFTADGGTLGTSAPLGLLRLLATVGPAAAPALSLNLSVEGVPRITAGAWTAGAFGLGLEAVHEVPNLGGFNDRVFSVRVPAGCRVVLYEHAGFLGATRVYTGDEGFIFFGASSLRVHGDCFATVFDGYNRSGNSATFPQGDDASLVDPGLFQFPHPLGTWNDVVSSLRVSPGCTATLYQHDQFGGTSQQFTGEVAYVGNAFNDWASSIRLPPGCRATLFEAADFQGSSRSFPPLARIDRVYLELFTAKVRLLADAQGIPGVNVALTSQGGTLGTTAQLDLVHLAIGAGRTSAPSATIDFVLNGVPRVTAGTFGASGFQLGFAEGQRVARLAVDMRTPTVAFVVNATSIPGLSATWAQGSDTGSLSTGGTLGHAELRAVVGERIRALANGGIGSQYDATNFRGKLLTGAPTGTVREVCAYVDTGSTLEVKVRPGLFAADAFTVAFPPLQPRSWNCATLQRPWTTSELFLYKSGGDAAVGYEAVAGGTFDSYRQVCSGCGFASEDLRRAYQVKIDPAVPALLGQGIALRLALDDVPSIASASWGPGSAGITFGSGKAAKLLLEFALEAALDANDLYLKLETQGLPSLSLTTGAEGVRFSAPSGIDSITAILRKGTFAYDPAAYGTDFLGAWLRPATAELGVSARITGLKGLSWQAFDGNDTQLLGLGFTKDKDLRVIANLSTAALIADADFLITGLPPTTTLAIRPEGVDLLGANCATCMATPWLQAQVGLGTPAAYHSTPYPVWPWAAADPTRCDRTFNGYAYFGDPCGISGHVTLDTAQGGVAAKLRVYTRLPTALTLTTETKGAVPSYTLDTGIGLGKLDLRIQTLLPKFPGEDPDLTNNRDVFQLQGGDTWNDVVSSLKVSSGCTVTLFEHSHYGGSTWTFSGVVPFVGSDANDQASSLRVTSTSGLRGCSVTLWEGRDHTGTSTTFSTFAGEDHDLRDDLRPFPSTTWDNSISSLDFTPDLCGVAWLYDGQDLQGSYSFFTGDIPDLGSSNDRASSVLLYANNFDACTVQAYADADYAGASRSFFARGIIDPDLADDPSSDASAKPANTWNDIVSSAAVSPNCSLYLYDDTYFRGGELQLPASHPDLRLVSHNDMASSLQAVPNSQSGGICGVVLYSAINYNGDSRAFSTAPHRETSLGDDTQVPPPGTWGDQASSVKVSPGCVLTLYEHEEFLGSSATFLGDTPALGAWNDQASSLRLNPVSGSGSCSVELFEHSGYQGASTTIRGSSTSSVMAVVTVSNLPRLLTVQETFSSQALENGGAGPAGDGNLYRGKFFPTVTAGTISEVCAYATSGTAVTVAVKPLRDGSVPVFSETIPVLRANDWNCKAVQRGWNHASLFLYNIGGDAAVGLDTGQPYDSWYSNDGGASWSNDDWRRGYKVLFGPTQGGKAMQPSLSLQTSDAIGKVFLGLRFDGDFGGAAPVNLADPLKAKSGGFPLWLSVGDIPTSVSFTTGKKDWGAESFSPPTFSYSASASTLDLSVYLDVGLLWQLLPKSVVQAAIDQGVAPGWLATLAGTDASGHVYLLVEDVPHDGVAVGTTGRKAVIDPAPTHGDPGLGNDPLPYSPWTWNDVVTDVQVPDGCAVTLFDDDDFQGKSRTVYGPGYVYLGADENKASSIKVFRPGSGADCTATLWDYAGGASIAKTGHDHRLKRFFADFQLRFDNSKSAQGTIVEVTVFDVKIKLGWYYDVAWYFSIRTLSLLLEDLGYLALDPDLETRIDIDGKLVFHFRAGQGATASFGLFLDAGKNNDLKRWMCVCVTTPTLSYVIDPGFISYQLVDFSVPVVTYWYDNLGFFDLGDGDHHVAGLKGRYPGNWQFDLPIALPENGVPFRGLALNYPGYLGPDGYSAGTVENYRAILDPRLVVCGGAWEDPEVVCGQVGRLIPAEFVIAYKAATETQLGVQTWKTYHDH